MAANSSANDRIRLTKMLIEQDKLLLSDESITMSESLCTAVWSDTKTEDTRLDDGTIDVGTLNAFEYTIERESVRLIASESKKEEKQNV
ncbi:hypothetical protein SDC9_147007 [bioreactor metagenome]|uniref:Uncharacterized protein n=1 Tax=bioreactor metagenome TaxID=1076179 RepID=A0A645EGC1_9ZZZZ